MSNLAHDDKFPTQQDIDKAEQELVTMLEEAEKYTDEECRDFKEVAHKYREKLINATV